MSITNTTLEYYNENAASYVADTSEVDFHDIQDRFISKLPKNAVVLDFGCGSGRDTKYFLEKGFQVTAIDGSKELCHIASEYTGITVKQQLFQELADEEIYDGIWACSSILHLSKAELHTVFFKMATALKRNGYIYTSFKYGEFEGYRNQRYFTDFTYESFEDFIGDFMNLRISEHWISGDIRQGRETERWLNLLIKKE